jgi:lambda repressor-like predicted transcriptional regulator
MVFYRPMNGVQTQIAQLQKKGWTLAAIADEIKASHNMSKSGKLAIDTPV